MSSVADIVKQGVDFLMGGNLGGAVGAANALASTVAASGKDDQTKAIGASLVEASTAMSTRVGPAPVPVPSQQVNMKGFLALLPPIPAPSGKTVDQLNILRTTINEFKESFIGKEITPNDVEKLQGLMAQYVALVQNYQGLEKKRKLVEDRQKSITQSPRLDEPYAGSPIYDLWKSQNDLYEQLAAQKPDDATILDRDPAKNLQYNNAYDAYQQAYNAYGNKQRELANAKVREIIDAVVKESGKARIDTGFQNETIKKAGEKFIKDYLVVEDAEAAYRQILTDNLKIITGKAGGIFTKAKSNANIETKGAEKEAKAKGVAAEGAAKKVEATVIGKLYRNKSGFQQSPVREAREAFIASFIKGAPDAKAYETVLRQNKDKITSRSFYNSMRGFTAEDRKEFTANAVIELQRFKGVTVLSTPIRPKLREKYFEIVQPAYEALKFADKSQISAAKEEYKAAVAKYVAFAAGNDPDTVAKKEAVADIPFQPAPWLSTNAKLTYDDLGIEDKYNAIIEAFLTTKSKTSDGYKDAVTAYNEAVAKYRWEFVVDQEKDFEAAKKFLATNDFTPPTLTNAALQGSLAQLQEKYTELKGLFPAADTDEKKATAMYKYFLYNTAYDKITPAAMKQRNTNVAAEEEASRQTLRNSGARNVNAQRLGYVSNEQREAEVATFAALRGRVTNANLDALGRNIDAARGRVPAENADQLRGYNELERDVITRKNDRVKQALEARLKTEQPGANADALVRDARAAGVDNGLISTFQLKKVGANSAARRDAAAARQEAFRLLQGTYGANAGRNDFLTRTLAGYTPAQLTSLLAKLKTNPRNANVQAVIDQQADVAPLLEGIMRGGAYRSTRKRPLRGKRRATRKHSV